MNLVEGLHKYESEVDGCRISFTSRYNNDSDEVILFLHGLGCSSDSFSNLFDKDYFPDKSLLLIDLPGFGESSKPELFTYSMEDTAAVVEKLISTLPFLNIHIAAHSMGGAVALLFSNKFYEKVISFSNIEGNLIKEDCGLMSSGIVSVPFEEYSRVVFPAQMKEFEGHNQFRLNSTTAKAVYKSASSLVNWSYSGKLLEKFILLKSRKCYFYGEENSSIPVLREIEGIPSFMIHGAGHAMMTENPEEFYSKLKLFIQ
jgi:pimeloyl-ACP methyl ester carboxylesterase